MRPQTVLKIDPVGKSADEIYAVRDQWISAYEKYIEENPDKEDLGELLIRRVTRAADMLVERYVEVPLDEQNKKDPDSDFDFDNYNPEYKDANASLDGDFPLGDAYDADFITPYFTIENLVRIQFGETHSVPTGHFVEPAYDVLIRKGFIYELMGDLAQAEACYRGGGMSESVRRREFECRRKKDVEGEMAYATAQHHMESGEWSKVYDHLQKAVDMENIDAMVDMGLSLIYGTFGIPTSYDEGLELLRKAAMYGNMRACVEIVELYDSGSSAIDGEEAEKYCKKAAEAGDKSAAVRLEDGFDTRPLIEILEEQAQKGSVDALWYLSREYSRIGDDEKSVEYLIRATDADQIDALLYMADMHLDSDAYQAEEYFRRAAEKGSEKAIIALGTLALKDTEIPFWIQATGSQETSDVIREQHKTQFAWYLLAAEGGLTEAMTKVSVAYHYGYPCDKNDDAAFLWASRAADNGDATAMYQIGYFYENACGCDKDMNAAALFYTQAAEAGIFEAMMRLVEIYGCGKDGIEKDAAKANRYRFMSGIGRD
ncbi:MAG: sel1 repeat family protein [Ruminococcaceae bacterium]|nr:sel1 repeat family protein [Oscillospiraceae bacterium]